MSLFRSSSSNASGGSRDPAPAPELAHEVPAHQACRDGHGLSGLTHSREEGDCACAEGVEEVWDEGYCG